MIGKLVAIVLLFQPTVSSEDSYLNEALFATKTPYSQARQLLESFLHRRVGHKVPSISHDGFLKNHLFPTACRPVQLSVVIRHGTRFPSGGDIAKVARFFKKWQTLNIVDQFINTKGWINRFTEANDKKLGESGVKEHYDIGKRFAAYFNELFQHSFKEKSRFELMISNTQRTIASAYGFVDGLSDALSLDSGEIFEKNQFRNDLLRFYDRCAGYKYEVKDNDAALVEYNLFMKGHEMKHAVEKLSQRVSASGDKSILDTGDLRTIWIICGFERALHDVQSPWCEMLTTEETSVLEYAADLKSFWRKSYGYTLNYEQSCPLLSDVMQNINDIIANKSAPGVSLYFGHSETLLPFQAILGLFQDEQVLISNNFNQLKDSRHFRTSLIASFAANLALVTYECGQHSKVTVPRWPKNLSKYMVQVLASEHAVPLPFTDQLAVSLEDFEHYYYQHAHHCDFDALCQNKNSSSYHSRSHGEL